MAIAYIEGFDKYGPPAASATTSLALNSNVFVSAAMRNEWAFTFQNADDFFIGPPLSSTGGSLCLIGAAGTTGMQALKSLGANYSSAIGGCRMQVNNFSAAPAVQSILFLDSTTMQAGIGFTGSGQITVINEAGSVIATSTATVSAGSPFYLEWSFGISASGAYSVYLNGTQIISGTGGNFHGSSNNFYNALRFQSIGSATVAGNSYQFDDLYIDDGTGTPLLTSPVVETHFPNSDSAVTFTQGAFSIGYWNQLGTATTAPGANTLYLRKFTAPSGGVTLNSVSLLPQATSAGANFKAVLYADSAGAPAALIATGTQVTGTTAFTPIVAPFASGQTLTASTVYWIGVITDTSVVISQSDTLLSGVQKANTYSGGAPNPAGTVTTGVGSWLIWGNCSAAATNNQTVAEQAPNGVWGDFGYVVSSTVGNEDLFGFPALTGSPVSIYAVAIKGYLRDQAAGARTVTLNTKSSTTDSPGTNAGFTPSTSYGWFGSMWDVDPNTSSAWTVANLNAALGGYKITA